MSGVPPFTEIESSDGPDRGRADKIGKFGDLLRIFVAGVLVGLLLALTIYVYAAF